MFKWLLFWGLVLGLSERSAAADCPISEGDRVPEAPLVSALTSWPSPPFVAVEGTGQTRFYMISDIYAEVLQTPRPLFLVNDTDELKYLPFTMSKSSLLLVLRDLKNWSPERAQKVLSVVLLHQSSLSLVWLGEGPIPRDFNEFITRSGGKTWSRQELLDSIRSYTCRSRVD